MIEVYIYLKYRNIQIIYTGHKIKMNLLLDNYKNLKLKSYLIILDIKILHRLLDR